MKQAMLRVVDAQTALDQADEQVYFGNEAADAALVAMRHEMALADAGLMDDPSNRREVFERIEVVSKMRPGPRKVLRARQRVKRTRKRK